NDGVVNHELGHAVFHIIIDGAHQPPPDLSTWSSPAATSYGGLNEGLADTFAALRLGLPGFLDMYGFDRDLAKDRVLDADQAGDITQFEIHDLGAFVAAAMWSLSQQLGARRTAELVLASEHALHADPETFNLAVWLALVVAAAATPAEHDA